MGFDVDPQRATAPSSTATSRARDELLAAGDDVVTDEIELLGLFADLAELSRNRPAGEDLHTELRVHSSKEHFHAYLQSLDVDRGGLPQQFRDRLARVLAHYGVTDWDRTPELEEAVFRIFLAQQRSAPDVQLATELLQRWIAEPPPSEELAGPVRDLLERLVRSTQLRFPVVGDLARSTRFRWFDQPLVDAERSSVLAGVRDEVAALAADPDAPDRTAADGGAGGDPGADRAVPRRAARDRRARAGADARGAGAPPLPRARPARPAVVRARGSHVRGGRLHPRRPPHPAGLDRRHHRRARPTRTARWPRPSATRSPPATPVDEAVRRPLRALARRPGVAGAGQRGARPHRRCPALRPRRTPGRGGGLPWRGPAGQLLHLPSRSPTAASSRTTWSAACTRWSAAGSTCGGCATSTSPASRRPRTCCSTSASRGRTPPTAGSSPWRRSASSPSSATRRAGSPACRTRSGRWRTASRRSAASVRRAARPGASSTPTTCGSRSGRSSRPTSSS